MVPAMIENELQDFDFDKFGWFIETAIFTIAKNANIIIVVIVDLLRDLSIFTLMHFMMEENEMII